MTDIPIPEYALGLILPPSPQRTARMTDQIDLVQALRNLVTPDNPRVILYADAADELDRLRTALKKIVKKRDDLLLLAASTNDYDSDYVLATEACADIARAALNPKE